MSTQYVGEYELDTQLGSGGMGAVWAATHVQTGERAAVKVMHHEVCDERSLVVRFFNEARAADAIRHPGIARVYDHGFCRDNRAYIAMELLDGEPLSERLRREGRLPWPEAINIARWICWTLSAAHQVDIVHRDLKPANVFLARNDDGTSRVVLLDFGIAKLSPDMRRGPATARGVVLGTPRYMAPEQCTDDGVDCRTDLYALGCILFEMACGRPVFEVRGFADLMRAHCVEQPPEPGLLEPSLPPVLCTIIIRLLAKSPETRYPSAARVDEALALLQPESAATA